MKLSKVLNEVGEIQQALQDQDQAQVDVDDLSNPALKSILQKIQNLKVNYEKQLQALQKQMENVKVQSQRKAGTNATKFAPVG
jgi:hypothetical protein